MRILIVTHYFPPETGAPQARLSALAATWAEDGDDVTVLTGMPNHPTGVLPPSYRRAVRRRERRDGYRILRTWLYATPSEGAARTTLAHLSFMASSVLLGWRATGPADVVVASSPTFCSVLSGWLLARLKRARFVVEIRDLWPAIFVELGVLTNRRVIRALERLELAAYAAADQVVVVSEGFRDNLLRRGVPPEKVHTVRNGVDIRRFTPAGGPGGPGGPDGPDGPGREPSRERPELRARLGAGPEDCLVLYAGTHGIAQGLSAIADAAALLDDAGRAVAARATNSTAARAAALDRRAIRFAFIGDGADKRRLQRRVAELGLRNVVLLPGVPNAEMPALLAAADICLVPLRKVPLLATFIPSKMFEYLATGKAVIGSVAGEAAQILAEAGAVVVPPEDSGSLAAAIVALAADPQLRSEMGRVGRTFVEWRYDREALALEYRKILALDPVGRSRSASPTRLINVGNGMAAPSGGKFRLWREIEL
jgi:glycosyltransferase involved in cell wall biosynthesis